MLLKVAETFEHDVGTDLKRVLRLLEPIIIFSMGVLVAFVVVAMMLAIFSSNGSQGGGGRGGPGGGRRALPQPDGSHEDETEANAERRPRADYTGCGRA